MDGKLIAVVYPVILLEEVEMALIFFRKINSNCS